jgi:hypothetical protein
MSFSRHRASLEAHEPSAGDRRQAEGRVWRSPVHFHKSTCSRSGMRLAVMSSRTSCLFFAPIAILLLLFLRRSLWNIAGAVCAMVTANDLLADGFSHLRMLTVF